MNFNHNDTIQNTVKRKKNIKFLSKSYWNRKKIKTFIQEKVICFEQSKMHFLHLLRKKKT